MSRAGVRRWVRELCIVAIATFLAILTLATGAPREVVVLSVLGVLAVALVQSGGRLGRTALLSLFVLLAGCLLAMRQAGHPSWLALMLLPALPASAILGGLMAARLRARLTAESAGQWTTITVSYHHTTVPTADSAGTCEG